MDGRRDIRRKEWREGRKEKGKIGEREGWTYGCINDSKGNREGRHKFWLKVRQIRKTS